MLLENFFQFIIIDAVVCPFATEKALVEELSEIVFMIPVSCISRLPFWPVSLSKSVCGVLHRMVG